MTSQKAITTAVLSLALLVGVFSLIPSPAKADFNPLNPLDPFCLFSCSNNSNPNVTNTYTTTGSYNTNSYNTNTNNGTVYTAPVYATTPVYSYPSYPTNPTSPLYVSCYPSPTGVNMGTPVTWSVSISGGNGSFYTTWSGTDGLSGNGSQIVKSYYSAGSKNASVTVTSGGQTMSQNCSGTVTVYETTSSYPTPIYTYPPVYTPPVYVAPPVYNPPVYYPPTNYSPLSVSCSANTTYSTTGSYITWTAYVTGGNYTSSYSYPTTYSWSGTDGLYGSQSAVSTYYSNPGTKYAYITVYANGQNATAQCTNPVTITSAYNYSSYGYGYTQPVQYGTNYNSNLGLQIACAVDKVSTAVGSPVTWTVEAIGSGSYQNYTYAWTGSDGLSGNQAAVIKSYYTPGLKSAVVTVTAPNGQSQSKACTNTVTVKAAAVAAAKKPVVVAAATPVPTPQVIYLPPAQSQAAAAGLFSLQNVPWGWVAVLVILVLLGMVFYMLFNKKKI